MSSRSVRTKNMNGGSIFESAPAVNANIQGGDALFAHKARKYHYKIQKVLKDQFQNQGRSIPSGYESYLGEFQA